MFKLIKKLFQKKQPKVETKELITPFELTCRDILAEAMRASVALADAGKIDVNPYQILIESIEAQYVRDMAYTRAIKENNKTHEEALAYAQQEVAKIYGITQHELTTKKPSFH